MDGRPPKRQRRSDRSVSDSQGDRPSSRPSTGSSKPALPSRPRATQPTRSRQASQAPANRIPSSSPSPQKSNPSSKSAKSKSLHSFFQPATENQRWSSQKFEPARPLAPVTETTLDADVIEDDYDSYDDIFIQHLTGGKETPAGNAPPSQGPGQVRPAAKPATKTRHKSHSTKRFILPTASNGSSNKQRIDLLSAETDRRPWAQRFAPSSLEELAVHKKKVADVKNWLEEALTGKRPEVSAFPVSCYLLYAGICVDTATGGRW